MFAIVSGIVIVMGATGRGVWDGSVCVGGGSGGVGLVGWCGMCGRCGGQFCCTRGCTSSYIILQYPLLLYRGNLIQPIFKITY